jgi:uncharacterized integral membrane protein
MNQKLNICLFAVLSTGSSLSIVTGSVFSEIFRFRLKKINFLALRVWTLRLKILVLSQAQGTQKLGSGSANLSFAEHYFFTSA